MMNFERLFLTEKNEFYRVALDFEDIAFIMVTDTLDQTPKEYLRSIMDEDGETAENFFEVKIAICRELVEEEKQKITGFIEDLLSYKPDIDYSIQFFSLDEELNISYSNEEELADFLTYINKMFDTNITFKFSSINKLIQK
ncbi:hypothetical protein AAYR27_10920 [Bacillus safensis]|nr:hypothetical protein [Bacillus safensis]MEC0922739.1 hypothetical protein [Bacillus safensis]MEC0995820.1 hypothetical protein [Bacillus safensis]PLT38321.1 hypothetical protein CUU65_07760 [Bacillus safensis]